MKFHSKCLNKEGKPVVLMVRADSEKEARQKLFEMYKVIAIIEMKPYEKFKAQNIGKELMREPKLYRQQFHERNFRKLHAKAKIL